MAYVGLGKACLNDGSIQRLWITSRQLTIRTITIRHSNMQEKNGSEITSQ